MNSFKLVETYKIYNNFEVLINNNISKHKLNARNLYDFIVKNNNETFEISDSDYEKLNKYCQIFFKEKIICLKINFKVVTKKR